MQWAALILARVCIKGVYIQHHISLSIWIGLKAYLYTTLANCRWPLGDGCSINFWNDRWLSQPFVDFLQCPRSMNNFIHSKVKDFIKDGNLKIPRMLLRRSSSLLAELKQTVILINPAKDVLIWSNSNSGKLSMKEASSLLQVHNQLQDWGKIIWCNDVPPSKTFLIWRLIHGKIPTDDINFGLEVALWSLCVVSMVLIMKPVIICSSNADMLKLYGLGLVIVFLLT